jgi:hypothetical protein
LKFVTFLIFYQATIYLYKRVKNNSIVSIFKTIYF